VLIFILLSQRLLDILLAFVYFIYNADRIPCSPEDFPGRRLCKGEGRDRSNTRDRDHTRNQIRKTHPPDSEMGSPRPAAAYVHHGSVPEIRRLKPSAAQERHPMFESMSIPVGIIFGLTGFALAILLGMTLYKDRPSEAQHKMPVVGAQERKTA
jgi:hypothetical protein